MTTIKGHNYQYDINKLLSMDETGLVSSFVLQMDDILSESTFTSPTEQRLVDETIRFLYDVMGGETSNLAQGLWNQAYKAGKYDGCDCEY